MAGTQIEDEAPLRHRIFRNPRPAVIWVLGVLVLTSVEFGALLQVITDTARAISLILPGDPALETLTAMSGRAGEIPTLLNREVIPNQGYRTGPNGPWEGTFLGLEPKYAWLLRVGLIYAYAFLWLGWLWYGYLLFRQHYRYAAWTPRDDMIDRLRGHRWGQFGFLIVFAFIVMSVFAPALGPTTVERNIFQPYSYEIQYWSDEEGSVQTILVGNANLQSKSSGAGSSNVGPWQYDDFGRFHPFGTLATGKDLFTFLAAGARISLTIGIVSMGLSGLIAVSLALLTAYYKGLFDLLVVITSDSVQALPVFLVLILGSVVFSGTWVSELYDGALVLIGIFVLVYWPFLWRAIRGPSFQTSEQEWIDAARSFGQKPRKIMRKHMAPYVIGYLLVYTSMSLGGVIIAIAGLSFLGLGIAPPTPEWGRAIDEGQQFVATQSWHISLIPGLLITLVVTAFNALGDGIRDAIDPQSHGGTEEAAAAGGGA